MKLEALCSINNGTFNKGDIFSVSEKEGEALINVGAAKRAAPASKPSDPKPTQTIVDTKASREGIAAKRMAAEDVVKKRKEKTNGS